MKEIKTKDNKCLRCGINLNTTYESNGEGVQPKPGDCGVCGHCGMLFTFKEDMTIDIIPDKAIEQCPSEIIMLSTILTQQFFTKESDEEIRSC